MIRIKTIEDVVQYQLCSGCGVCAAAEPERYEMEDVGEVGMRPRIKSDAIETTGTAFELCPGHSLERQSLSKGPGYIQSLAADWGPVKSVYEGYAVDEVVRLKGSSGGAVTALGLYGLTLDATTEVVHVGARLNCPYRNETKISTTADELLMNAGSRYAPASPCDQLHNVKSPENTIFVGKPCDVAAASRWEASNGVKFKLKIAFFCAGVPSTQGNINLLYKAGLDPDEVMSLRYRGNGWPGDWTAEAKGGVKHQLSYQKSWGYLQQFRQWRCYICPDHIGEFADIAVGDPWYRSILPREFGSSLIVVRTEIGARFLESAIGGGFMAIEREGADLLPASQPNLLKARGSLWGRLVALRLSGAAAPSYRGFNLMCLWVRELTTREKISSIAGTIRRVFRRRLRKPLSLA